MKNRAIVVLASLVLPWLVLAEEPAIEEVHLAVGDSHIVRADIRRAALGDGKIVNLATPEKGQLLLFGSTPGRTTAQLWLRDGSTRSLRIVVTEQDGQALLQQVKALLADVPEISARLVGARVVLEGEPAHEEGRGRVAEIAALFPGQVLDFVGQAGLLPMVQMDVRLIEVRRDQLRELGLRWDNDAAGAVANLVAGSGALSLGASINSSLQSRLQLLTQKGMAAVLAEPTLACRSGGTARFVSGGEIPIPITDGLGSTNVQYKEYGVILEVRPRADQNGKVFADVDIELSQVDASIRIADYPGFIKKRTSTAINAQSGDTIAIAGLVLRDRSRDRQGVPGLSAVPLVGELFSATRRQQRQTELLILITPRVFDVRNKGAAPVGVDQAELLKSESRLQKAGGL
jgi:pilus assembly protein CpaC